MTYTFFVDGRQPTLLMKSMKIMNKQAGAELCQAQNQLRLVWLSKSFSNLDYQIDSVYFCFFEFLMS